MLVQCELCPKGCIILPGHRGECRIRINLDGKLTAVTYGYPCSLHVDPVEKKPLFHFFPGSRILSLATVGCNLHCKFCQNWEISQADPENVEAFYLPPESLPKTASSYDCRLIAYTYTDPVAFYEYTLDSCRASKKAGIKNVLVTAGYLNTPPLKELYAFSDAANIDLKAYSDSFYQQICGGSLKPVLNALVLAKEMGVWLEVTNLIIPTLNDSDKDIQALCQWMKTNLGKDTPLHFSRFFPMYLMQNLPPTPSRTLEKAFQIAKSVGLDYVYIGNLSTKNGENTFCPNCRKKLIQRDRYVILENNLEKGQCPGCQTKIPGVWS
ncbi:MAG: AmmeMemoRadiSam system radical SAM enzyme [Candidatus Aureabacteria bacterium]|nr:AmmeMemoRadiSam system radical SAM enzyme [Candidatus Auribacterota bacterium]